VQVLIYDPTCPKPYNARTLEQEALGGTEATVIRIAEGLDAQVMQHNRTVSDGRYLANSESLNPRAVVLLRSVAWLPTVASRFPNAKLYLWMHDLAGNDLIEHAQILKTFRPTILAVSDFHVLNIQEKLSRIEGLAGVRVKRIYNPIDDELAPLKGVGHDPNRLVFFSSPHKGLEYTLQVFSYLRRMQPEMRLLIANPGYLPSAETPMEGVTNLGTLAHRDVINYVHGALCTFYPNTVFPETFGLVLAESNAVGTPCIAHQFGAAPEVLDHPAETLDCRDYRKVVDRVLAWRNGARPTVRARGEFRLKNVLREWRRLFIVQ
jgi:glycosyltransferase involved in cell wall biosynthesis